MKKFKVSENRDLFKNMDLAYTRWNHPDWQQEKSMEGAMSNSFFSLCRDASLRENGYEGKNALFSIEDIKTKDGKKAKLGWYGNWGDEPRLVVFQFGKTAPRGKRLENLLEFDCEKVVGLGAQRSKRKLIFKRLFYEDEISDKRKNAISKYPYKAFEEVYYVIPRLGICKTKKELLTEVENEEWFEKDKVWVVDYD